MLRKVALRDQVPEATKAAHLLEIGLELEEDQIWNEIAEKRDTKSARFVPHARVAEWWDGRAAERTGLATDLSKISELCDTILATSRGPA